jgi:ABC-type phosphate/phosphonate transport system ATPase subunit
MIGLRNGRMVFDGGPRTLDRSGIQEIYGGEGEEDVDENVTSVSTARLARFGAA